MAKRGHRSGLAALAASVALLVAAAAPEARAQEPATVRVAVEGAYPPFNYLDNGELQGFEVDLLKALCEVIRARCVTTVHEWDGIVRGLINREYDAIMSSLEITERRAKRIAFTRSYYRVPAAFIARKDASFDAVTPAALAGQRIGVVSRSDPERFLRDRFPEAEIGVYGKLDDANLDLFTERLDLVLGDKLALAKFLDSREGACCRFVADAPPDPAFFGQGYGIGVRKDDEALRGAFDRAIAQVMADGTYDRIRAKYIPFDTK